MKLMKLLTNLCAAASALILSGVTFAHTIRPTSEPVLLPGTKIVAGDLSKNEFFIVADNGPQVKKVANKAVQKAITHDDVTKIKMALNRVIHQAEHKRKAPRVITVMNKSIHKKALAHHHFVSKKNLSRLKVTSHRVTYVVYKFAHKSSHQFVHKFAHKKQILKTKLALNRIHHKTKNGHLGN
jgi:hypothetical protein